MATDEKKEPTKKRTRVSQSNFPQLSIQKTLRIIQVIQDQFSGQPTAPHDVALALPMEPTSGSWRNLTGTSIAYGLTEGGYNAKQIEISPLGKRIVAPIEEGDDKRALREAVLRPVIMKQFFEKYNHGKFPDEKIAMNNLASMGLPQDRLQAAFEVIVDNGVETGMLRETPTGYFVAIDEPSPGKSPISKEKSVTPSMQPKVGDLATPSKTEKNGFTFGNGLYVNFEIHIAADTPVETVEAIFKNMRKYLMENGS